MTYPYPEYDSEFAIFNIMLLEFLQTFYKRFKYIILKLIDVLTISFFLSMTS